jgi:hypothetical protein
MNVNQKFGCKEYMTQEDAFGIAATAWCGNKTKHKVMDCELAFEFARILQKEVNKKVDELRSQNDKTCKHLSLMQDAMHIYREPKDVTVRQKYEKKYEKIEGSWVKKHLLTEEELDKQLKAAGYLKCDGQAVPREQYRILLDTIEDFHS